METQTNELKEGIIFHPKDEGQYYFNNRMKIIKITSLDNDGLIFWISETPIKYSRRWNKGSLRVWFFKEYCEVLK